MAPYYADIINLPQFKKTKLMENLDLIILTIIVSVCFFGFAFSLYNAQKNAQQK